MLSGSLPTVLFSVETGNREFDSKLILGAALAAHGCRAVVGHKEVLTEIAQRSRRVVWQGKSLFSVHSDDHLADRLAANDSAIMFISDEGAMHQADSWVQQTLQKHWVTHFRRRKPERLCVWGSRQRNVIADAAPELKDVTAVTGSARFDLCRPRFAWTSDGVGHSGVDGPYILVCARFGAIAHANGIVFPFTTKLNPAAWPETISEAEITDLWFSKWRRDTHDFAEFVVFVRALAKAQAGRTIVVRPHPSESMPFYETAFSAAGNVRVIRTGNAVDWMRPADLVVHSGSTTGIESVLAERPTLNFLPSGTKASDTDIEVAREAGTTATTIDAALAEATRMTRDGASPARWSKRAVSMLNNLREDALPVLVTETLAVIREADIRSSEVVLPKPKSLLDQLRGLRRRPPSYVGSKRGTIDRRHVERLVDGCRTLGIGTCRLRLMTGNYAVLEPALAR